jgi:voltage-gated potassium channel
MQLFGRAFRATRREIWVSLKVLAVVTLLFAIAMYVAEHFQNPEFSFWDALVWTFVKYVEDPADIAETPITVVGKIVGTLVGVLGIAIFAVPAGLIGSGLMDAMAEEKREQELQEYRRRMHKSFRRTVDKTLRGYLNTLPDGGGEKFKKLNFVPQRIPVSRIQLRQGINMKDIFDICREYPEFRLKNLAEAMSDEEHPEDSFVVEHFPLNRPYGCCINRHSKVTIVSTSSCVENGTGWFTYYLAKFGGFNYVSKDIEVDPDELDSFYNLTDEPLYEKRPRSAYDAKKDKEAIATLDKKQANRHAFLDNIRMLVAGEDSWVILVTSQIKNSDNPFDFHFASTRKDGSDSTIINGQLYQQLCQRFDEMMIVDYELKSELQSTRYPLTKNNLGYKLSKQGIRCNTFVLRPSCDIVNFDNRKLLVVFRIAKLFNEMLDGNRSIMDGDVADLSDTRFGYLGLP